MAFCSQNTETITLSNYSVSYPSTSCLPGGTGFSGSDVDSNTGIVTSGALTRQVSSLLSALNAIAPSAVPSGSQINTNPRFSANSQNLRNNVQNEYCYYYVRYQWALGTLLTNATTVTGADINNASSDYNILKANTIRINTKLNQIIQLLQSILDSRNATLNTYYGGGDQGVNMSNSMLDTSLNTLIKDSTTLQNVNLENNVKSSMINYTLEKNQSSRNLLAVYGFMNIVAIGLVFYLYRGAKSQ